MQILTFAYACEPGRGSEPGAGWGLVRALASFSQPTVLVGPEHERTLSGTRLDGVRFIVVDEPWWGRYAKLGRVVRFLVYLAWLRRARRTAQMLIASHDYSAVHHASYAVHWLPTPAASLGLPFVFGPAGGAVTTPIGLWPALGWRGMPGELLDMAAVRLGCLLPATRRAWSRAAVRVLQNQETISQLPARLRNGSLVLNHALFVDAPENDVTAREPFVLWASPMESRKGPTLAVRAIPHTHPSVRLVMAGDGPERRRTERLAARLGVRDRIDILGWVNRDRVLDLMSRAAAVVFTGLREEGGIALAEAMLAGVPIIVVAHGGARTVAATSIDPGRVALIRPSTVAETARRLGEAMTRFVVDPPSGAGPLIDQERARSELRRIFRTAIGGRVRDG